VSPLSLIAKPVVGSATVSFGSAVVKDIAATDPSTRVQSWVNCFFYLHFSRDEVVLFAPDKTRSSAQ